MRGRRLKDKRKAIFSTPLELVRVRDLPGFGPLLVELQNVPVGYSLLLKSNERRGWQLGQNKAPESGERLCLLLIVY